MEEESKEGTREVDRRTKEVPAGNQATLALEQRGSMFSQLEVMMAAVRKEAAGWKFSIMRMFDGLRGCVCVYLLCFKLYVYLR